MRFNRWCFTGVFSQCHSILPAIQSGSGYLKQLLVIPGSRYPPHRLIIPGSQFPHQLGLLSMRMRARVRRRQKRRRRRRRTRPRLWCDRQRPLAGPAPAHLPILEPSRLVLRLLRRPQVQLLNRYIIPSPHCPPQPHRESSSSPHQESSRTLAHPQAHRERSCYPHLQVQAHRQARQAHQRQCLPPELPP